jgi:hypothetical protein
MMLGKLSAPMSTFHGSQLVFSLGLPRSLSKTIRGHFSRTFGPFNLKVSLKNHTFLLLDAPGLVEEDYQRASRSKQYEGWDSLPGGAVEFVKRNAVGKYHRQ